MPDFKQIVREKLLGWNGPEREEVIQELAGHLEDHYEDLLHEKIAANGALQAALSAVRDWRKLQKAIASAKGGNVTERAKHILIPGMAAVLICILGGQLLGRIYTHVYPHGIPEPTHWSWLIFFVPEECLLVGAGAVGAACSFYLGGNRRERIWAAELPAFCCIAAYLVMFIVGFTLKFVSEHMVGWQSVLVQLQYLLRFNIPIVVALLLGALPFLTSQGRLSQFKATGT